MVCPATKLDAGEQSQITAWAFWFGWPAPPIRSRLINVKLERNRSAYLFAIFIAYLGPFGAGFGYLVLVYIFGLLAAVPITAYHDY